MRSKKIKWLIGGWILTILAVTVVAFVSAQEGVREKLGSGVELLALNIAQNTTMTPAEVAALKSIEYDALVDNPINRAFEEKARVLMARSEIQYIYVEILLPETPYAVLEGEASIYEAREGSPLEVMYLLDAVPNEADRFLDEGMRPFADKSRYSILSATGRRLHSARVSSYYVAEDKWGKYISGYAPFYDTTGNYVGMLGVDLDFAVYQRQLSKYLIFIGIFIATNLLMLIWVLYLVFKVDRHMALSSVDTLTRVYNRGRIWELLIEKWYVAKQGQSPLVVLILDIDYFKEYNDYYGHIAGDEVLKKLALVFRRFVDTHNGCVGRYGGDEFIFILPELLPDDCDVLLKKLFEEIKALKIPHLNSSVSDCVSVSVGGVVTVPRLHATPEEAFDIADAVLYEVKQAGRNQYKMKALH